MTVLSKRLIVDIERAYDASLVYPEHIVVLTPDSLRAMKTAFDGFQLGGNYEANKSYSPKLVDGLCPYIISLPNAGLYFVGTGQPGYTWSDRTDQALRQTYYDHSKRAWVSKDSALTMLGILLDSYFARHPMWGFTAFDPLAGVPRLNDQTPVPSCWRFTPEVPLLRHLLSLPSSEWRPKEENSMSSTSASSRPRVIVFGGDDRGATTRWPSSIDVVTYAGKQINVDRIVRSVQAGKVDRIVVLTRWMSHSQWERLRKLDAPLTAWPAGLDRLAKELPGIMGVVMPAPDAIVVDAVAMSVAPAKSPLMTPTPVSNGKPLPSFAASAAVPTAPTRKLVEPAGTVKQIPPNVSGRPAFTNKPFAQALNKLATALDAAADLDSDISDTKKKATRRDTPITIAAAIESQAAPIVAAQSASNDSGTEEESGDEDDMADKKYGNPYKAFGNALRTLRENENLAMEELAKMLDVVPSNISKWECGVHCPIGSRAVDLIKLFPTLKNALPAKSLRSLKAYAPELAETSTRVKLGKRKGKQNGVASPADKAVAAATAQNAPMATKVNRETGKVRIDFPAFPYAVRYPDGHMVVFAGSEAALTVMNRVPGATLWKQIKTRVRVEIEE